MWAHHCSVPSMLPCPSLSKFKGTWGGVGRVMEAVPAEDLECSSPMARA